MSYLRQGKWLRSGWTWGALAVLAFVTWQALTSSSGVPDPTDPAAHLSHGAVATDSALLVFREGLECIRGLASVLASRLGATRSLGGPVAAGAAGARGTTVAPWFVVGAVTG